MAKLVGGQRVKAQMLAKRYKAAGGELMALKKSQKSLKKWTKQKWRTKSGKPSTQGPNATGGGGIYLLRLLSLLASLNMLQPLNPKRKGC